MTHPISGVFFVYLKLMLLQTVYAQVRIGELVECTQKGAFFVPAEAFSFGIKQSENRSKIKKL